MFDNVVRSPAGRPHLVGIDVGTTACKAAVCDATGMEVAVASVATPWETAAGCTVTGALQLRDAALDAARRALREAGSPVVAALGVASMAESGVLLDRRGEPVADVIAWHDPRGDTEADHLGATLGVEEFTARTGLPVSRLCTLAKYAWLRRHTPTGPDGVRWLGVAEWVAHSLGARPVAELSLASRSGMLDRDARSWWGEALAWADAPPGLVPDLVEAGEPVGRADGSVLEGTAGAVLTIAGLDHLAAAVGSGAVHDGDAFSSCGTAEAVVRAVTPPLPRSVVLEAVDAGIQVGWHVLPGHQALVAGFSAGLGLRRVLALLGTDERSHVELDRRALAVAAGADGVTMRGITTPSSSILGLTAGSTDAHVWRAALEAVAAHSAGVLARIDTIAGPRRRLVVTGGWWQGAAYSAVKRSAIGDCHQPAVREAGARGAAILGGVAAGLIPSVVAAAQPAAAR